MAMWSAPIFQRASGFSKEDRDEMSAALASFCESLSCNGAIRNRRRRLPQIVIREEVRAALNFVEIYVECPIDALAECVLSRGLNARARRRRSAFTGIERSARNLRHRPRRWSVPPQPGAKRGENLVTLDVWVQSLIDLSFCT